MLRKLLPRGKIIVLLRDTVERAYVDLVRTVAAGKGADADDALLLLTHGCMRAAACAHPGAASAPAVASWASAGAPLFKKCLAEGFATVPALAAAADAADADALDCLADSAGPAGVLDWGVSFSTHVLTTKAAPLACAAVDGAAAASRGSPLHAEAAAWLSGAVRQLERRAYAACLPPAAFGRDALADLSAVTADEAAAAFRDAAAAVEACSQTIEPGVALPVPVDLMAGVVAGYDLNLVAVSADLPKTAKAPAKVLVDGEPACFPGGAEGFGPNTPAHALARSMYLRPLQRVQAAYGRDVVSIMESSAIKTRPLSLVDPILTDLNVYKPSLEPSKVKTTAAKMGWRGDEGELDLEAAGTIPELDAALKDEMVAFFAPYDAALRAYMGEETAAALTNTWATSKAAGVGKKKLGVRGARGEARGRAGWRGRGARAVTYPAPLPFPREQKKKKAAA